MFSSRVQRVEEEEKKDVFAPVADLMVGVVFIFIIMVLALSLVMMEDAVPRPLYDQTAQQLEKTTTENQKLAARAEKLESFVDFLKSENIATLLDQLAETDATRARILHMLKDRLAAQGVGVDVDLRSGVLRLPTGNLFPSGEAEPTEHGREVIKILGGALADVAPCFLPDPPRQNCPKASRGAVLNAVYIEGHTDNAPFHGGSPGLKDNWDLSAARAIAAFRIAREADPRVPALKNADNKSLLGVSGYADTRPVAERPPERANERADKAAMEADRRIEVRLIMAIDRDAIAELLHDLNRRLDALDGDRR